MKLFDVFKNMLSLLPESEYSDRHFEADCLIEFVLGKKRADLGSDFTVTEENRPKQKAEYARGNFFDSLHFYFLVFLYCHRN